MQEVESAELIFRTDYNFPYASEDEGASETEHERKAASFAASSVVTQSPFLLPQHTKPLSRTQSLVIY